MGKIRTIIIGILTSAILAGFYILNVAQIPYGMGDQGPLEIWQHGIIMPDSLWLSFGNDEDVVAKWKNDKEWFSFERRPSLWENSPADGFVDFGHGKQLVINMISWGDSTEYTWFTGGGFVYACTTIVGGANAIVSNTANTVINVKIKGAAFKFDTTNGYSVWYESKVKLQDSTDCSAFLGFVSPLEVDSLRSGQLYGGMGFEKCLNSNTWRFVKRPNGGTAIYDTIASATLNANDMAAHTFGLFADADNKQIDLWLDGTYIQTVSKTGTPNTMMTPVYEVGDTDSLRIYNLRAKQEY